MKAFFVRWAATSFAVFAATGVVPGITADSVGALLWAGLLLGILNAVVRPVLLVLSLPLIVLSFGLVIPLINAMLLSVVGGGLIAGFHVAGFGAALLGAIVISVVSWGINNLLQEPRNRFEVHIDSHRPPPAPSGGGMKRVQGRVIENESDPK